MKEFTAREGYVFSKDGKILGSRVYAPDDFDESTLIEIEKQEEVEDDIWNDLHDGS